MDQEVFEEMRAVLVKAIGEDECIGDLLGILTGTATAEFGRIGTVEFDLTDLERAEWLAAIVKSQQSRRRDSITSFMSAELENLVCGNTPERYRSIPGS